MSRGCLRAHGRDDSGKGVRCAFAWSTHLSLYTYSAQRPADHSSEFTQLSAARCLRTNGRNVQREVERQPSSPRPDSTSYA